MLDELSICSAPLRIADGNYITAHRSLQQRRARSTRCPRVNKRRLCFVNIHRSSSSAKQRTYVFLVCVLLAAGCLLSFSLELGWLPELSRFSLETSKRCGAERRGYLQRMAEKTHLRQLRVLDTSPLMAARRPPDLPRAAPHKRQPRCFWAQNICSSLCYRCFSRGTNFSAEVVAFCPSPSISGSHLY